MLEDFQNYVETLREEHGIPAISLGVWYQGELYQAASGVLNVETKVEATTDSVFQVGSLTKMVTASLIMRLVDSGLIDLDCPVKTYLKDFRVADPYASDHVTVRHLLNHTSGLAGDFFPENDRTGGDAIARYVDRCFFLPQVHPLGKMHSYSNSGYVIAGRILEVVMGVSWFDIVKEQFIKPLGLSQTFIDPQEAPRFRTAIGHFADAKKPEGWQLAANGYLPLCLSPAGATLSMSVADIIAFARMHLNQGVISGIDDARWLSPDAVEQMQTSNISLPPYSPKNVTDWGLGWQLINSFDTPIVAHDGASRGQNAMLRLLAEHGLVFAGQINAKKSDVLPAVFAELMADLLGIDVKLPSPSKMDTVPSSSLVGVYDCLDSTLFITEVMGKLSLVKRDKIYPDLPPVKLRLEPIDAHSFVAISNNGKPLSTMIFLDRNHNGEPAYLYSGFRLYNRQ